MYLAPAETPELTQLEKLPGLNPKRSFILVNKVDMATECSISSIRQCLSRLHIAEVWVFVAESQETARGCLLEPPY